ncbi:hypothetical protein [Thalassobacillus hwangdonensis]|uniref:Uncharacterized protein n=1 Tax=Thalassobacillus hwangdonensis TaxID=546108 RepID=A0ABW3KZS8_9BACI
MLKKGIWIGTVSGFALGIFLWLMEEVTGQRVYTLLMNVDFIPVIGDIEWPFFMEWLFHLIISWGIGIVYVYLLKSKMRDDQGHRWSLALTLSTLAALTYFPLTELAIKPTPDLDNLIAITYWTIGHIIYSIVLKISYK